MRLFRSKGRRWKVDSLALIPKPGLHRLGVFLGNFMLLHGHNASFAEEILIMAIDGREVNGSHRDLVFSGFVSPGTP